MAKADARRLAAFAAVLAGLSAGPAAAQRSDEPPPPALPATARPSSATPSLAAATPAAPVAAPIAPPDLSAPGLSPSAEGGSRSRALPLGRPLPGSVVDPGASGPGIGDAGGEMFLGGALDPKTGWPFVLLDHFRPRPGRVERFWVVRTRSCPQVMGTDPWPCLEVLHFDAEGQLVRCDPAALMAQSVGRPVLVVVQGNLTTPDVALGGLLWTHSWLQQNRALPPGAVVVAFDWPSQRLYRFGPRDVEEKARRAFVAGYHLARFVQGFPGGSHICLMGQSFGGRVVPSALHLLGGGALADDNHAEPVGLPTLRPDLILHGIIIAGASDHDWLDPDHRLDHALLGCRAFLNLYNRGDRALTLYPILRRSGHHRALGRLGLRPRDLERLGPLAARYEEHDLYDRLGPEHTLLDTMADRQVARWLAPYLWAPDPGPAPPRPEDGEGPPPPVRSGLGVFR